MSQRDKIEAIVEGMMKKTYIWSQNLSSISNFDNTKLPHKIIQIMNRI